ncbi:hypothetical protein SLEP1_g17349 [Rubroshorea leprosula]|uniref:Uncharacterized protein n=1 Tax=Rubroshorea leprosula TaxID=152421 RepID=A0AAV5J4I3_9ROSI|nr:hypothetical protein SLEP1_g17349 [Rubroshorea leprosula]
MKSCCLVPPGTVLLFLNPTSRIPFFRFRVCAWTSASPSRNHPTLLASISRPQGKKVGQCKCAFPPQCYGGGDDFLVVNFYRFVMIKEPEEEIAKHLDFLKDKTCISHIITC